MWQLIRKNRYFFIPYLAALITCGLLLAMYSKTELHIFSNRANSPTFDIFFKHLTNLGDGAMIALLFIALLFVKYRFAFAFLFGSLATSAVVNILKKLVFTGVYRPSKYFELFETYQLHFVDGVKLHALQSFPSGHAATAFNIFLTLAILVKNNTLKLLLFMLAALTAYSRVYLSQHFLIDITAGSLIASVLIILIFGWFETMKKPWLESSLIRRK